MWEYYWDLRVAQNFNPYMYAIGGLFLGDTDDPQTVVISHKSKQYG